MEKVQAKLREEDLFEKLRFAETILALKQFRVERKIADGTATDEEIEWARSQLEMAGLYIPEGSQTTASDQIRPVESHSQSPILKRA